VRSPEWSVEYKFTDKQSFSLKASELELGERNAILDGREFLFGISLGQRDWVVLSNHTFETLLALAHGNEAAHNVTGLGGD
jgi:hypothetical protein